MVVVVGGDVVYLASNEYTCIENAHLCTIPRMLVRIKDITPPTTHTHTHTHTQTHMHTHNGRLLEILRSIKGSHAKKPKFLMKDGKGYRMVIKIFRVLEKFGPCSICSQNLDECSLARARKIFAIARMLGFSLKFALSLKIS